MAPRAGRGRRNGDREAEYERVIDSFHSLISSLRHGHGAKPQAVGPLSLNQDVRLLE